MSLIIHDPATISQETKAWLSTCPNPEEFKQALQAYTWLSTVVPCAECGEDFARHELRRDEAGPCSDGQALICRGCWEQWEDGTVGDPDFRPPPFPAKLDISTMPKSLPSGEIWTGGKKIGRVE